MPAITLPDGSQRKYEQPVSVMDVAADIGPGLAKGSWEGSQELARQGYVQNTVNEWHGPDRSIVSISDGRMFWIAGSCVVCFAGPDVQVADSGGTRPVSDTRNRATNGATIAASDAMASDCPRCTPTVCPDEAPLDLRRAISLPSRSTVSADV